MQRRLLPVLSVLLLAGGVGMLGAYAWHLHDSAAGQAQGIAAFEAAKTAAREERNATLAIPRPTGEGTVPAALPPAEQPSQQPASDLVESVAPDTRDWSDSRIAAYRSTVAAGDASLLPEGVMRIPSVALEVPVFTGTSEAALTIGAGRIEGTPPLGSAGNVGIAAHRDGWFRALKDVGVGDPIEVETLSGVSRYRVTELFVAAPEDVHVLDPTASDSLTLVTCYPFYFVGAAPERYIVRAERR